MSTLGQTIRARRLELGLTLAALSARIGCAKGYLSQIENGRRHHAPSEQMLGKVERALDLDGGSLIALGRWDQVPSEFRTELRSVTEACERTHRLLAMVEKRGLSDAFHSGELAAAIEELIAAERGAGATRVTIPRADQARIPILESDGAFVCVPGVLDPDAFGVRVVGDAMAPDYRAGDIVIFSPRAAAVDGSDCFIRFAREDTSTFARVFFERDAFDDQCVRLQPVNCAHRPRVVRRADIPGMHPTVCVIRGVGGVRNVWDGRFLSHR